MKISIAVTCFLPFLVGVCVLASGRGEARLVHTPSSTNSTEEGHRQHGAVQHTRSVTPSAAVRLNEIQVLGSHNSYKAAIDTALMRLLTNQNEAQARALDYAHPSLHDQLDRGLRSLELDVYYDPQGGRYANPFGVQLVRQDALPPGPDYDPQGVMDDPGFKVLHVQDIDFRSNCLTLQQCLGAVRQWSDAHPDHVPIIITMNAKDDVIDRPGFTNPLPFDTIAFDALDREIRTVLGPGKLIEPDEVRGDYATLEAAVRDAKWPMLRTARGRVMMVLDEQGEKLERYRAGRPALNGRAMFANAEEGTPAAAFRIVNDPIAQGDTIQRLVQRGYMVRTRADANTVEARRGETRRREAAFASGAHVVTTDYYRPDPSFGTGYKVVLPGGGAMRCNPVTASAACYEVNP